MSLPAWPGTLPDVGVTYNSDQGSSRVSRTIMATGRVRQRMVATAGWRTQKVQWTFTEAQFATFTAFVRDTLALGSLPFTAPLAFGAGLVTVTAQLVKGLFQTKYVQPMWVVTADIEVVGQNYENALATNPTGYLVDDTGTPLSDGGGGGILTQ